MKIKKDRHQILEDLLDIIEPYIDADMGHSGECVYGNYVDWQPLDELEDSIIDSLCQYFDIDIKLSKEKKIKLLRKNDIPEKCVYEGDADFPESAKYWKSEFDEYEYYLEHNIEYEKFVSQIDEIAMLVDESKNDLIKKSLVFSAFVFTESFVKSKIVKKMKNEEMIVSEFYKNIADKAIDKDMRTTEGRKKLFAMLFQGKKLDNIPNINIRNYLAHDIGSVDIEKNAIVYTDVNKKSITSEIEKVFSDLKAFAECLNAVE